jgi:hypothetical protein
VVATLRDEAGGQSGGFADVLDPPLRRRPPQAGSGYGREAGCWRSQPARDASRPWVCVPGKCPVLLLLCAEFFTFLALTVGIFVHPQGLRSFKLSLPPVPEDAADRTARRLAAEKEKENKDAEKARARERMRAREALEKRRQRQARDGLPLEPSPEMPNDDDDDDDEDDDMAARFGLSSDPRPGQGSPSQPPGGLAPPVFRAGTPRSRSEERRRAEGVLDPLVEIIGVTPGGQAEPLAPQEQVPVPIVQEAGPSAIVTTPGQAAPSAPWASEAKMAPKPAAGQPSAALAETGARWVSPQARLALPRSG